MEHGEILHILVKEKTRIQNILKILKSLEKEKAKPFFSISKTYKYINQISKLLEESSLTPQFKQLIKEYLSRLEEEISYYKEKRKNSFTVELEKGLEIFSLPLKGHYPLLKLGLYTIEVDFDKESLTVWYGPQQEKLFSSSLDIEKIVKALKEERTKIEERAFDDKLFLKQLYDAYNLWIYKNKKGLEEPAPIGDILFLYSFSIQPKKFKIDPKKEHYLSYSRAYFSFDLFRLKERRLDDVELCLITATRSYAKRKSDFLWIPLNISGDGMYVSHIKFKKVIT